MVTVVFTDIRGKKVNIQVKNNIKSLDLSMRNITRLDNNFCDFLPELETLWLNGNRLVSLHENVFQGVPNLRKLYLFHNKIKHINSESFKPLRGLKQLDLFSNKLSNLSSNLFFSLPNLEKLELNFNEINYFDELIFSKLNKLIDLVISNNNLVTLPEKIFRLQKLKRLSLSYNYLAQLPKYIFNDLVNLEELRLDNNPLKEFDITGLQHSKQLSKIELLNCSSLEKITLNPLNSRFNLIPNTKFFVQRTNIIEPPSVFINRGLRGIYEYYSEPKFSTINEIRNSFGIQPNLKVKNCITCNQLLHTDQKIQSNYEPLKKIQKHKLDHNSEEEQVCNSCQEYFDFLSDDIFF